MPTEPAPPLSHRLVAVLVVAIAAVFVWLLLRLDPDPRGFGTHEQLGMSACSWPDGLGVPCPTCGCTTAAVHLLHLSPWRALVTQPFGAAVAAGGLAFAGLALASLVQRRSFVERVLMLPYATITLAGIGVFVAAWGFKYLTWGE